MNSNKCLLIINPISGTSNKRGLDKKVAARLAGSGLEICTAWTTARGDATRLARKAVEEGWHSVIAAGGDGTVNETARALSGSNTVLGIIPCGSGNGLARHLDIPIDIDSALDIIAANHPVACDYGTVNGMPFFCTFGVGFDAAVSHKFSRQKQRGLFSYLRSTFKEYVGYHADEYHIEANGHVLSEKAFLVAVCNASQYGNNAYIAPRASMTDGLLDVTIVHQGNPLTTALVGVDLLTGYINRNTLIHTFRTPSVTIRRASEGAAHIDGEPVSFGEQMEIKVHPGRITIYTNPNERPFRPIITPVYSMCREARLAIKRFFGRH